MFDITLIGAAFAGLLSFASPCILPIVPFYLTYLAGAGLAELQDADGVSPALRRRAVIASLFFAAGILIIFVGLGATASAFGQVLREWFGVLRWIAAGIILIMGLHFLGVFRINALFREFRLDMGNTSNLSYGGSFLLGLAFAFGWTPCVGPVLAAILFTAAGSDNIMQGAILLFAYGLGMTLPFVMAAFFVGPFLRWAARFRRHLGLIEKIMGAMLVLFAMLIATDTVSVIADWMLRFGPGLGG